MTTAQQDPGAQSGSSPESPQDAAARRRARRQSTLPLAVLVAGLGVAAIFSCPGGGGGSGSGGSGGGGGGSNAVVYPVKVGPTGRYLVDQNGVPFMLLGDSPQAMIANLSESDADQFMADRASRGFNAVWVNLICRANLHCNADATTFDGIPPFTTPDDLSTPNEAYFERADRIIKRAADRGLLVILDPIETSGWLGVMHDNGLSKCRDYGRFLGSRYKDQPNILWMSGNDFQTWRDENDDAIVREVALGIRDTDTNHIHTVELDFFTSSSLNDPTWAPIISLNASYTYFPNYAEVLHGYSQSSSIPVFMVESNYEFENNTGMDTGTPNILRRQEWWTALSGATGQLYGNKFIWPFSSGWQGELGTPGAVQFMVLKVLFAARAWYELVPDLGHAVVTAGTGTFSNSGGVGANDYVTAARSPSGRLAVAYVPTLRTITVDMTQMSGATTARWFDPASGHFTGIAGSPFANTGSLDFTTPGVNDDGDEDWVLVLEVL